MLELTRDDFDGYGVQVWKLQRGKLKWLCVAWTSLVLIKPKISWPVGHDPTRHEAFGEEVIRIVYHPDLGSTKVQAGTLRVPDLDDLLSLRVKSLPSVNVTGATKRTKDHGKLFRCWSGGERWYIPEAAWERLCGAIGYDLDLRRYDPPVDEDTRYPDRVKSMLLAYRGGLRGVLTMIPEAEIRVRLKA